MAVYVPGLRVFCAGPGIAFVGMEEGELFS